jgi:hypothetical protein
MSSLPSAAAYASLDVVPAAGVGHFRTTYELTGAAGKLLGSFTPAQLATVVEALGSAGVNDVDLFKVCQAGGNPQPCLMTSSSMGHSSQQTARLSNQSIGMVTSITRTQLWQLEGTDVEHGRFFTSFLWRLATVVHFM